MLTGHRTVEMCRRAFKSGAAEFLESPSTMKRCWRPCKTPCANTYARANATMPTANPAIATPAIRTGTRSARPHRRWSDQQGNGPRIHTVAAHRRDASREFVCEAGGGIARRFDSAFCRVGGRVSVIAVIRAGPPREGSVDDASVHEDCRRRDSRTPSVQRLTAKSQTPCFNWA